MEKIGLLRKNLVYPERVDDALQIKGMRVLGGDDGWRTSSASSQGGKMPKAAWDEPGCEKISSWAETSKTVQKRNSLKADQSRQSVSPPTVPSPPETEDLSYEMEQGPQLDGAVRDRMTELLRRFAERTARTRARIELPPSPIHESTPNTQQLIKADVEEKSPDVVFIQMSPRRKPCLKWWDYEKCTTTIDPQGVFYLIWLSIVTFCYAYNAWTIPFRWSFPYQTPKNTPIWLTIDSFCDLLYLVDVAIVKPRISYLSEGFWVQDPVDTRQNYIKKFAFRLDLVSLFPLEVLYLIFGTHAVWLRIPRLFKFKTLSEFYASMDRVLSSPFIVRIGRTLIYMFYLIHLNACAYYAMSKWEGIGSNGWVFSGIGNAYVRCFYFSTKTATSIGKNAKPENLIELTFMTIAWLMGVFVIALMIGQIRDIIATATKTKTEYLKLVDDTKEYIIRQNLPNEMIRRATTWFNFTWEQQHTLDESSIINGLPKNLKTDVALSVHIEILSKVQLFKDCDEALLRDLVLKLKPVIYLPGDLVCRKGDVGKEMYIVKMGQVQVMGGPNNDIVLATLSEGSFFGEVSLLGIGADRRTANVRSKGFSNLFVLSKDDLNAALVFYPEAQEMLRKKARNLMKKNKEIEKCDGETDIIIQNPSTPKKLKILEAVMQAFPEESGAAKLLRYGSKALKKQDISLSSSDEGYGNDVVSLDLSQSSCDENSGIDETKKCLCVIATETDKNKGGKSDCCCDNLRERISKTNKRKKKSDNSEIPNIYSVMPISSETILKDNQNNHHDSPRA